MVGGGPTGPKGRRDSTPPDATGAKLEVRTRLSGPPPPMDQTALQVKPKLPRATRADGLVGGAASPPSKSDPPDGLARTKIRSSEPPPDGNTHAHGSEPPDGLGATRLGSAPPSGRARTRLQNADAETAAGGTQVDPVWMTAGGRIRKYELIRELGRGGMGTVWLARDQRLGRRVAIKFLSLSDPVFRDRFLVEARATAQCQHDNIVVVHEVDEHEGTPFMVLEFLEGQPLSDFVYETIVPAPRAVDYMIPVVRGLARAHAEGLAHRDLKPDNIFVTDAGTVKVLDFGIAKLFHEKQGTNEPLAQVTIGSLKEVYRTVSTGSLVGTLPYMSPEQWGLGAVDHRTDLWAVGIILFEMVTGQHPVEPLTADGLTTMVADMDVPLPSVARVRQDLPDRLVAIIDRCLQKRSTDRFASADELLDALVELSPSARRSLSDEQNPFPGLAAFQESDAARFFGREKDVARACKALETRPLLAIVGASGVGKSSFVRAGILPALKAQGEEWESVVTRPGRTPFDGLAGVVAPLIVTDSPRPTNHEELAHEHHQLAQRFKHEPGYLGALLRARARQRGARYLVFVDQMEELYTLVDDPDERLAFTRCLCSLADDPSAPLRVVLSIRSDLLDRVSEDSEFQSLITRGITLLGPPTREGLRRAVTQPPAILGYGFEDERIIEQMLEPLEESAGSLPLLQFSAARLWEQRDERRKLLTRSAFDAMGGIGGALASHADEVLAGLSPDLRSLTRTIFQRLVTTERTRAILDMEEARQLHPDPRQVDGLIQHLADSRLVVLQTASNEAERGATIEVVHESLLGAWPTLRRWLDESQEDSAFIDQLRAAAKQWDARKRDKGLLWRGEALEEAVRFQRRYQGPLADRERAYLQASVQLATRASRIRRTVAVGTIAFLGVLVAVGSVALVTIRNAEQKALENAEKASQEAARARSAEKTITEQLQVIQAEEAARLQAEKEALEAIVAANLTREELEKAYAKVRAQLLLIHRKEEERKKATARAAKADAVLSAAEARATEAQEEAERANEAAKMSRTELEKAYAEANVALAEANRARQVAEQERRRAQTATEAAESATRAARQAKAEADALLAKERARNAALQKQQGKIVTELK